MSFKNSEGSGWMRHVDWDYWRSLMAGDHDDREKGRRHKPAWNAWAAALITQATPEEAENMASKALRESQREWRRKHGVGRIYDQFLRHLPVQHYAGTLALFFIPVVGPFLSGVASAVTPMVEAASRDAIAKHEAHDVTEQFREDYYRAMDSYLRGETDDLPVDFLTYHAEVIVPAARDVRDQVAAGQIETSTGLYSLDMNGLALWEAQRAPGWEMESYLGVWGRIQNAGNTLVYDLNYQPANFAVPVITGLAVGFSTYLLLRGVA
jgi:hypothetical protein